jgi:hypothetical protein
MGSRVRQRMRLGSRGQSLPANETLSLQHMPNCTRTATGTFCNLGLRNTSLRERDCLRYVILAQTSVPHGYGLTVKEPQDRTLGNAIAPT